MVIIYSFNSFKSGLYVDTFGTYDVINYICNLLIS